MSSAPFVVNRSRIGCEWGLWMRRPYRFIGWFESQAAAIDYAYKHRPWLP